MPWGTLGTVAESKARKANILYGETAKCSAIVDVMVDAIVEAFAGRVKLPHLSLCLLTQATPRPDYVSRNG